MFTRANRKAGQLPALLLVLPLMWLAAPVGAEPTAGLGGSSGAAGAKPLFGPDKAATPGSAGDRDPQLGYRVFLAPLLVTDDACNDVDRWLLDIARSDGRPEVLEASDFLRGVREPVVAAFLAAAGQYVKARWLLGNRTLSAATEFLDTVGKLELPPRYTIFMLYGHSDMARLRRGHVLGFVSAAYANTTNSLQGHEVDWQLTGEHLGGETLWPWRSDPYQGRWPLAYLGLGMVVGRSTGAIWRAEERLGDLTRFELDLYLAASMRYRLNPEWLIKATGTLGFGFGTLKVDRVWKDGSTQISDPCLYDSSAGLDFDAAAQAVRCSVTNSFGFFQAWPYSLGLGVQAFGWLELDARWQHTAYDVDKAVVAPQQLNEWFLRLGIAYY